MSKIICGDIKVSFENFDKIANNNSNLKIFKIKLGDYSHLVPHLSKFLNPEEFKRSQKYHFEKDINTYITCRALLRCIIANQTGLTNSEISLSLNKNNKPHLASNRTFHFNLSHSNDYAIIAISNMAVGIDLEYLNNKFEFEDVMPSIFNTREIETVLLNQNKLYLFYKIWTRKEAVVKATGKGINNFLTEIQVLNGSQTINSKFLDTFNNLQVLSFNLNENYVAAVALNNNNFINNVLKIHHLPNSIEDLIAFSQYSNL
jgi:4'-phosphopantetheinyl transferase